jgi:hypothetical protein
MKTMSNIKTVLLGGLVGTLALSACSGSNGKNGKLGTNGLNGDAGTEGKPSLIRVVDEPAGEHCAAGGKRIDKGPDANGNGTLENSEVTASTFVCAGAPGLTGADGGVGPAGGDGDVGLRGHSSLLRTSKEADGANCAHGGLRIETGVDVNDDGTLQDSEVNASQTQFLCEPAGVGACTSGGALPSAGDYTAPDGAEHWLRKTATAATYTIVPAGAPDPATPPKVFRVSLVCGSWLLLEVRSNDVRRLDLATVGGGLRVCLRSAANATAAAALATPDSAAATTGCGAGPWTTLTRQP